MPNYEKPINQWRTKILASQKLQTEIVDELEDHLRAELDDLSELNIAEGEMLMLAQHRMGDVTVLENEFGKLERHKRWLQQLTIMLGGYILLTLLFQLVQVIAVTIGSAKVFTQISQGLGAQIYALSSMSLLAVSCYGLWKFAQRRSPMSLLGYQPVQNGSLQKIVQNSVIVGLIVIAARTVDTIVSRQLNGREELHLFFKEGEPPPDVMETLTSFSYMKSMYDGTMLIILMALSFVVLMVLIRQKTHQSVASSS